MAGLGTNPKLLASIRVGVGLTALLKTASSAVLEAPHPAITGAWLILSVALIAGWKGRWAAAGLFLVGAYGIWRGGAQSDLYLLVMVLPFVVMSDSERSYSMRPHGTGPAARWPLVVMRWQLSIAYLFLGVAPLPFSITTAAAVFVGLGVWSRRLRTLAFAAVLPLHMSVLTMAAGPSDLAWLGPFSLLAFVLSACFLDLPEKGRVIVWDDGCSFCGRWISVIRWLDVFGAMRFVGLSQPDAYVSLRVKQEEARVALQLVEPGGRIRSGFDAVRGVVSVLPGGWFVAPYLALPGIPLIGRRVYRRVAAGRTCTYMPADI